MAGRRAFLTGLLAAGLVPKPSWADVGNPAYLSAGKRPDGAYVLCGLGPDGEIRFERPLPARGHAAAGHPTRPEAVAFARRPGTYAIVIDCVDGRQIARLEAPAGRHFFGHGAFSADGDLLFTTENEYGTARGLVGVWDARNGYARIGELASGGTGPHEIRLVPGRETLVVANGGIETHPETGRSKLNIPSMRPNLTYLSFDGAVQDQLELGPDLHKNSIRHLAVFADGTVAFAMQWQGDVAAHPPLLGLHSMGEAARLVTAPPEARRRMVGYAGSVAASDSRGTVAITSPRGGKFQVFDRDTAALKQEVALEDVCGVVDGPDDFLVTNGLGLVARDPSQGLTDTRSHPLQWDNHLIAI